MQRLLLFQKRIPLPQKLKPHSAEWFAALRKLNPLQADLAESLIKRKGHKNICTACGDAPHGDFMVDIIPYITLRLCRPCWEVYGRAYGDKLVSLPMT